MDFFQRWQIWNDEKCPNKCTFKQNWVGCINCMLKYVGSDMNSGLEEKQCIYLISSSTPLSSC